MLDLVAQDTCPHNSIFTLPIHDKRTPPITHKTRSMAPSGNKAKQVKGNSNARANNGRKGLRDTTYENEEDSDDANEVSKGITPPRENVRKEKEPSSVSIETDEFIPLTPTDENVQRKRKRANGETVTGNGTPMFLENVCRKTVYHCVPRQSGSCLRTICTWATDKKDENDCIDTILKANPEFKAIVRGLDGGVEKFVKENSHLAKETCRHARNNLGRSFKKQFLTGKKGNPTEFTNTTLVIGMNQDDEMPVRIWLI